MLISEVLCRDSSNEYGVKLVRPSTLGNIHYKLLQTKGNIFLIFMSCALSSVLRSNTLLICHNSADGEGGHSLYSAEEAEHCKPWTCEPVCRDEESHSGSYSIFNQHDYWLPDQQAANQGKIKGVHCSKLGSGSETRRPRGWTIGLFRV